MSELLPCPSTIPPAQPSKVVAALQNMMGAFDTPIRRRKFPDDAFIKEAIESARAVLAELGEGRE